MTIELKGIGKTFRDAVALRDIDLDVAKGELIALLGPSGSGKTTLLRIIAGLEWPDAGDLRIDDQDATDQSVRDRHIGFVFQHYALFRHMSVAENVAFGLRVQHRGKRPPEAEIKARVANLLELVQIGDLGARYPHQISGGQRQRVALARALINRPRVLLLDEPLGALDLKLREQMQVELKALQRSVGITFVFVTHDQGEALAMSDRLAVFNLGRIEQIGTPGEMYNRPATEFVAGFVGVSNVIDAALAQKLTGVAAPFTIRPERVRLIDNDHASNRESVAASGRVIGSVYLGATTRVAVRLDSGGELTVLVPNSDETLVAPAVDAPVRLSWLRRHQHPLGTM